MPRAPRYIAFTLCLITSGAAAFPLNSKKAPENTTDLLSIQQALLTAIPKAKAATVCIEISGGSGSGVIISPDGLIMTAAHVSTGVGKDVVIIMPNGEKLTGETLGLMAEFDAALVKITSPKPTAGFPTVEIDKTNAPKLGDWIFSLGHSGGFDKTRGAVARIGRLVRVANTTFQTDGTLIGGDSGGPLFDMDGRLIGIHSRVGQQAGMNMHVPVDVFIGGWDEMLASHFIGEGPFAQKPEKGKGYLGLATTNVPDGLKVTKVGKKSPAEAAGIREGDILHTINGTSLATREEMQALLAELAAGDKLEVKLTRTGNDETILLRLGSR